MKDKKLILIVGKRKTGTTALYNALCASSPVDGGKEKEPHFWSASNRDPSNANDLQTYLSNFVEIDKEFLLDASTSYCIIEKKIAELNDYISDVLIIECERNNAARTISAFYHMKSSIRESRSLSYICNEIQREMLDLKAENKIISIEDFKQLELSGLKSNFLYKSSMTFIESYPAYGYLYFYESLRETEFKCDNYHIVKSDPFNIDDTFEILHDFGLPINYDKFKFELLEQHNGYSPLGAKILTKILSGFKKKSFKKSKYTQVENVKRKYEKKLVEVTLDIIKERIYDG